MTASFPHNFRRSALLVAVAALAFPAATQGQDPDAPWQQPGLQLRVIDPRLAAAFGRLLAGSPSATAVVKHLSESGLPVTIGTPEELVAQATSGSAEALPDEASGLSAADGPQWAWVALSVDASQRMVSGSLGLVERVWVVVDANRIEQLIRARGWPDADARIEDDLTVALAHEFVAHVGSVALSRRIEDFCDDPVPGGETSGGQACSLRVENAVRRELNQNLGLRGNRRFHERRSYALEVMNFGSAGPR